MAPSPIKLKVTTIISMEINLLVRFLTALLYTRTEIPSRASSKMAGGITARLPLQTEMIFLRAKTPDIDSSQIKYQNRRRSGLI